MGWFSDIVDDVVDSVRDVYDWTSDSDSDVGKVMQYAYPFNAPYLVRDAWRDAKDSLMESMQPSGSGSIVNVNSAGSLYGYTGSIVGRY